MRTSTREARLAPRSTPARPHVHHAITVVVLTRNEGANIAECVRAILAEAHELDFEVLVIDAASEDSTCAIVESLSVTDPRVRLVGLSTLASVGAARNVALDTLAPGRVLIFVSADATPFPGWLAAARDALGRADVVYGAQIHAPPRVSVAAVSRGLRYHFLERGDREPIMYASHVNAAYAPRAWRDWRFGESRAESALDDVLFATHAARTGLRVVYAPEMIVAHKDATTLKNEWRKLMREARGWGALRGRLGWRLDLVAWSCALVATSLFALSFPSPLAFATFAVVVAAPAVRRITRRGIAQYGFARVALATLLAPFLDLAFLAAYAHGVVKPE